MSKNNRASKLVNLNGVPFKEEKADKKPSIMLGRPIAREPVRENEIKFLQAFFQLAHEGYRVYMEDLEGLDWWMKHHSSNRNHICHNFLMRDDCDYLVFIDDDTTYNNLAEDIKKMIALDKDMVVAICCCKPAPHFPNLGKFEKIGESGTICDSVSRHIYTFPEDEPFQVDFSSMGLTCIKRKVIATMPRPWCYFPPNYMTGNVFGEDVTFFFNAKMWGFELWCDPTIRLGHLGMTAWHYKDRADHWLDHKDKLVKEAKEQGWDCSHNLVPEVQEQFKKGLGPKRMYV